MDLVLKDKEILTPESPSVGEALVWATALLRSAGVGTPRLDAECLLAQLLVSDRLHLYAAIEEPLPSSILEAYMRLVTRRQAREPLAYLAGTKEFWSLSLKVTPAVFIPRPETEILIETALGRLGESPSPLIADIGCGSGAIAVALAKTLPHARIYATDISGRALEVARDNVRAHDLGGQIDFLQGDLLQPLYARGVVGQYDLIVSNPPYVASQDLATLPPEVHYEPVEALDGGPDGLSYHGRIVAGAPALLRPGGLLVLEMAPEHGASLVRLLRDQGPFTEVTVVPDLSGRQRLVIARYAGPGFLARSSAGTLGRDDTRWSVNGV